MGISAPQKKCEYSLKARIDTVRSMCLDRHIYIDTIALLVKGDVVSRKKMALRGLIGALPIVFPSRCVGHTHLRLHRPNIETIQYVMDEFPDHKVSRADIAMDFIVPSRDEAEVVSELILQALTMKWRRKGAVICVEETSYYNRKGKSRNIVAYADRVSKITGEAVAHIELRRFTSDSCRSIGLCNLRDTLMIDLVDAIRRQVKLSTFNWALVEKQFVDEAGKIVQKQGAPYPNSRLYNRYSTRAKAVSSRKNLIARVMSYDYDCLDFDLMKRFWRVQDLIDLQKNTKMMPKRFLNALSDIDIYPLIDGAVIIRPMAKERSVHREIMRLEQNFT